MLVAAGFTPAFNHNQKVFLADLNTPVKPAATCPFVVGDLVFSQHQFDGRLGALRIGEVILDRRADQFVARATGVIGVPSSTSACATSSSTRSLIDSNISTP
jgi:hypothetical protein